MNQKFGLLGCSNVAQKSFFPVLDSIDSAEASFIGSRSLKKAKLWAGKYNCDNYGSYDDVINSDVDAIYNSLPIGLHEEWSVKALKAGKHVLCEKSSTTSYASAIKMVNTARENNKRILEAERLLARAERRIEVNLYEAARLDAVRAQSEAIDYLEEALINDLDETDSPEPD